MSTYQHQSVAARIAAGGPITYRVEKLHPSARHELSMFYADSKELADQYAALGWTVTALGLHVDQQASQFARAVEGPRAAPAGHTKGPWTTGAENESMVEVAADGKVIARVVRGFILSREEAEANVSLILAAPNLKEEVAVGDKLLAEHDRLMAAIPGCSAHGHRCVPNAIEWVTTAARALEIADAQMFVVLRSYGHKIADETGQPERYGVPTGYGRQEFAEACDWLEPRGFIERFEAFGAKRVRVLREPGEAA